MKKSIGEQGIEHLERTKIKFIELANSQEQKGIEKYGKPLDPLDNYDWLQMALEEQVDGTKYLIAEMEKRKFVVSKIRNLLEGRTDTMHADEICHWLDILEGS